jgi:hypothetical protein
MSNELKIEILKAAVEIAKADHKLTTENVTGICNKLKEVLI